MPVSCLWLPFYQESPRDVPAANSFILTTGKPISTNQASNIKLNCCGDVTRKWRRRRLDLLRLHGPPMLADKANLGLVLYYHANFYRFEETSSYWSVGRISVFLCFSLVNQRHTSGITVYNRTVTNIENTVRAVHSCKSWFLIRMSPVSINR